MNKKVVVFGGGTGLGFLLHGLKDFPLDITAVITVSDNGSSTGKLREEFLMPAMGDIRNVIVNMSNAKEELKDLLQYRFDTYTDLNGHPIGNLMMVGMYNLTGSLKESIKVISDFLNIKHKILPLSEDYLTLMGETENGEIITGEEAIGHDGRTLKRLFYKENPHVDEEVIKEIKSADLIIFSMGSLYTSIMPHLICDDVIKAIDESSARILYTCNAVDEMNETDNYTATDHIKVLNKHLGKRKVDATIVANSSIPEDILDKYISSENKNLVEYDIDSLSKIGCEVIEDDILVIENNYIRHNPLKLATAIFNYLMR